MNRIDKPRHLNDKQYWFHIKEDAEWLESAHYYISKYYDYVETSGLFDLWKRAYVAYYGGDLNENRSIFDSSKLTKAGKAGQVSKVKINHYRNLVKHSLTLATSNKPSLTCVATNTDQKSQAHTTLGDSLLDYYLQTKRVGTTLRNAAELGCLLGEGWIHAPWNPTGGEVYEIDDSSKPVFEGDLEITHHSPLEVIRDTDLRSTKHSWRILRQLRNKFEVAAEHPEFKEDILNVGQKDYNYERSSAFRYEINGGSNSDSDMIPVWTAYHDKTAAMPDGAFVQFIGDKVLKRIDLPYEKMPLVAILPDVLHDSAFGYSPFNDILGPQQAHDNLLSTALSNNLTFGNQLIWVSDSNKEGLAPQELEGGLKIIRGDQPPQAIQLTSTAPELFNLASLLESGQETISGISSTIRGAPQSNIQSGAHAALVVSQSVQFGSGLEESYNNLLVTTGEIIISHLKAFGDKPRIAEVVGISKQPYLQQFNKNDIEKIKRISIQQVNALSKTVAGRMEMATQAMKLPPERVEEYLAIANDGQLPLSMQNSNPIQNIRAEGERLIKGEDVKVILTEDHENHILEHRRLIENPETKKDPKAVISTLKHIEEHIRVSRSMDPALRAILGQKELPPMQGAPLPQGTNIKTGVQGPPTPQAGPEEANMPNLPNLPEGTDPNTVKAYEKLKNSL